MFLRKLRIEFARAGETGVQPCPLSWIDNFAMRNFTNSAVFDDTLPVADGHMEAGLLVPLDALQEAMEEWFRRKNYLRDGDHLRVTELQDEAQATAQPSH
jgi:hypothetical protein